MALPAYFSKMEVVSSAIAMASLCYSPSFRIIELKARLTRAAGSARRCGRGRSHFAPANCRIRWPTTILAQSCQWPFGKEFLLVYMQMFLSLYADLIFNLLLSFHMDSNKLAVVTQKKAAGSTDVRSRGLAGMKLVSHLLNLTNWHVLRSLLMYKKSFIYFVLMLQFHV